MQRSGRCARNTRLTSACLRLCQAGTARAPVNSHGRCARAVLTGVMARAGKLKVYRTPAGFHDAYVAVPSQKAALTAWGSDKDLFARGMAELVTDPALTAEPLAHPGEVVKRSRGSAAEQIAALPTDPPRRRKAESAAPEPRRSPSARKSPSVPKPDRAPVQAAERALSEAEARHRLEDRELRREEEALAKRRAAMERDQRRERDELDATRDRAASDYDAAIRAWRG